MARVDRMENFCKEEEDWDSYADRLEQHFVANGVVAPTAGTSGPDRRVAILISSIGKEVYSVLKDMCEPSKPKDKSFEELLELLKDYYCPTPSVIAERHNFHRKIRREGESIMQFVTELKRLTRFCKFGNFLDSALRDQFVVGLNNTAITQVLYLEKEDLSFESAVKIAVSYETAVKNVAAITGDKKMAAVAESIQDINKLSLGQNEEEHINLDSMVAVNRVASQSSRNAQGRAEKYLQKNARSNALGKDNRSVTCFCCGNTGHLARECKYKNYKCSVCRRTGHLKSTCRNVKQSNFYNGVVDSRKDEIGLDEYLSMFALRKGGGTDPWVVKIQVQGVIVNMEVDSGSAVSVISNCFYERNFKNLKLDHTFVKLKSFSAEVVKPRGVLNVRVLYGAVDKLLKLFVIPGNGPPLLGRDWYEALEFPKPSIGLVGNEGNPEVSKLLVGFTSMFDGGLGTFTGPPVSLKMTNNAKEVFFAPRPLAFALRSKVELEIDRLIKLGIIYPVKFSKWATPIVPVLKYCGGVRVCGDFKVTINPQLEVERYPLPRVEELFTKLQGGQKLSIIDLSQAFQQLLLDERSQEFCTINTHRGLFRYSRLPFGVTSAPSIFQRTMDQVLQGLEGIVAFQDDVLVTGQDDEAHLKNLKSLLVRLNSYGFKVNKDKCKFMLNSVDFLGHSIDKQGLHTMADKVKAVNEAPRPISVTQLKSFLGLVNYYAKFLPNLAMILAPLHNLLRCSVRWQWTLECEKAFGEVKKMLVSPLVLTHYDPRLPVKLSCDASPYGVGAVISHVYSSGEERPIAYASRSLSGAEKNYAQIDREALAIIFGVRKFVQYLYGRRFILSTDHKPLLSIFGEKKGIPQLAANRLQRWAIILQGYDYEIQYVQAKNNGNADALSRLPLPVVEKAESFSYLNAGEYEFLPVTAREIAMQSRRDPVVSQVIDFCMKGWPSKIDDQIKPYETKKDQLCVEQGCLLWGQRVVVPPKNRARLLQELHSGHFGIVKMKSLARSYIWWPGLDKDVERMVAECHACLQNRAMPGKSILLPWAWPDRPWQRLHIDLAGPFMGKIFLVVVDSYTKWPEVKEIGVGSAGNIVSRLKTLFTVFGLPEHIVSDNGAQFASAEFDSFCQHRGIKHTFSPPYHPSTNGAAENMVKIFKGKVKALAHDKLPVTEALEKFIFEYRITPHVTTGESPATLMFGRPLRSRLDLIKPSIRNRVIEKQLAQSDCYRGQRTNEWEVGERVATRDYRKEGRWVYGSIRERLGPLTYLVGTDEGMTWFRHADQVLPLQGSPSKTSKKINDLVNVRGANELSSNGGQVPGMPEGYVETQLSTTQKSTENTGDTGLDAAALAPVRRYPLRDRKPAKVWDV